MARIQNPSSTSTWILDRVQDDQQRYAGQAGNAAIQYSFPRVGVQTGEAAGSTSNAF
jgi:hypothetical protein